MMRLVPDQEGLIWPDMLHKAPGRGAYLCMQMPCIQRLRDKQLQAAWKKVAIASGQTKELFDRFDLALKTAIRQTMGRLRTCLEIGRDAVMRRLWDNKPVLVFLSADAGKALERQIHMGMQKRGSDKKSGVACFPSSEMMGDTLGRDKVSVVAMNVSPMAKQLQRYCSWYMQFMEPR